MAAHLLGWPDSGRTATPGA